MEHKHEEKSVIMIKLMVGVAENIESRQKSLLEMEKMYDESLNMLMKLMGEGDPLHEGCAEELQHLKVITSNISHDMEQISKKMKVSKAQIYLQQKKFTEVILKHLMEITSLHIAAAKQQNDYENILKLTDDLKEKNETFYAKIIDLETEIQRIRRKREHEKEQQLEKENESTRKLDDKVVNLALEKREKATGIDEETKVIDIDDKAESNMKERRVSEISACVRVPVERLGAPKPTPPPRSTNTLFTEADWEVLRQQRNNDRR